MIMRIKDLKLMVLIKMKDVCNAIMTDLKDVYAFQELLDIYKIYIKLKIDKIYVYNGIFGYGNTIGLTNDNLMIVELIWVRLSL